MFDNALSHPTVRELVARSNELGSDPTTTNFGGGNTSAKGTVMNPATGEQTEVLWVKGSGGDLGTLTADGLGVLELDRVRGLKDVYSDPSQEDDMHEMLSFCSFGAGGRPPSIDTSMHGLLPAKHVDHLHPDAVIAIAAAADGERLTNECYGDDVAWLPWRRPGFELALQHERLYEEYADLKGVVLGGHGLTTWADTSDECKKRSLDVVVRAAEFIRTNGKAEPLGGVRDGFGPLDPDERRRRAAALAPVIRGLCSTDKHVVGHWNDSELVVDFIGREATPRVVPLGTSCPDHFIRTKVRPLLLDLPVDAPINEQIDRLKELHGAYRDEYRAYYQCYADETTPAMRGADPAIVLVPGVGMFSFGSDSPTARIAGEFYVNAINVIRGAEALSTYEPVPEDEKFAIEYWILEEKKLQRRPAPKPLTGQVALVTGGGSGIGRATARRLRAEGAVVAVVDLDREAAAEVTAELDERDHAIALAADVSDANAVKNAIDDTVTRFGGVDIVVNNAGLSLSKSLLETTEQDWDKQYDVLAKGAFLVSRHAAEAMLRQDIGGSIVYIVSKNAIFAGPNNVAYGSAKASQAHQVRLLAAELGEHGIRVNGVNPDAVVRGSGIFAGGWGAERAKVYGVDEEELGKYYAGRSILKKEVLPDSIANAVYCLVTDDFSHTTGLLVPVDSGVAAAFMR